MILQTIDSRIIAMFDHGTTTMQRRGWLPLNTLIMGNDCLFWSIIVWISIPHDNYFVYALAALMLYLSYMRWREAHGYWQDHRKAQRLNAEVLAFHRIWPIRCLYIFVQLILEWFTWDIASIPTGVRNCTMVSGLALVGIFYLRCCRFLGPGDFARQKQDSFSGSPQQT